MAAVGVSRRGAGGILDDGTKGNRQGCEDRVENAAILATAGNDDRALASAHPRRDLGRHNALDKLIGALARISADHREGFIAVTSRASVEMVQKAAVAGAPLLAAVSAPTLLAVETARAAA